MTATSAIVPRSTAPIVCFGTHILDTVARPVDGIPSGQNSHRIEQILHAPAGPAAGVAVDIAHLGFAVATIGVVGEDATGSILLGMLADKGVDVDAIRRLAGAQTSASVLLVDGAGNRPALHARGVNGIVTWDDIDASPFADAAFVHFGGLDALSALDGSVTVGHIRALRERGALVTMDFQSAAQHLRSELLELVAEADVFLPNDEQACGLMDAATVEEAAVRILELGTRAVVITCGADGLLYADQSGAMLRQPAIPAAVVDTTGCGDSVCAVYLIARSLGHDIAASLRLAAEAGAAVASGIGSLGALPDWDELVARAAAATTDERVEEC